MCIRDSVLGTGQLSLAKFLFITADEDNKVSTHHIADYFRFVLERIDWRRDVHFHTQTTMDTLDYSGTGLNTGSKVVFAAYGQKLRELTATLPTCFHNLSGVKAAALAQNGVVALSMAAFETYEKAVVEMAVSYTHLDVYKRQVLSN